MACHTHTDYRIDPKIPKSLCLGIISVPMKFGSISLKNGEVIQVPSCIVCILLFDPPQLYQYTRALTGKFLLDSLESHI